MIKIFFIIISSFIIFISCNNNVMEKNNIIINLDTEPRTIDPALGNANNYATYIFSAFEGLTKKDNNDNVVPGVAESWNISDDGLIYTFYLRTNAKWSDGKPVTAHDFVYSWKRIVDPNTSAPYAVLLEPIKNVREIMNGEKNINEIGVKAIDDYTFQIILNNPTAYFLDFTGYYILCPVREDIIKKYGDKWTLSQESYIGNGPFKMVERKIDENITMVKNTNYWDKDNIIPEKITFIMMNDNTAALSGIKNGSIHLSKSVNRNTINELKKENIVESIKLLASYYIEIDMNNEALKDVRVRKALSLAIDRDYIVKYVTLMNEDVLYLLIANNFKNYNIDRKNDYITTNYYQNIKEAKKLLAEAGYTNGENFPVLDFTVSTSSFEVNVAEVLQQMWKENLGVDVRINKYEYSTYLQFFSTKDVNGLFSTRCHADYNDPISMIEVFKSDSANHIFYTNLNYDKLYYQAQTNNNLDNRTKLLYEAEKLLVEKDVAIIPILNITDVFLKSPKLKDVQYDSTGFMRFDKAYIE